MSETKAGKESERETKEKKGGSAEEEKERKAGLKEDKERCYGEPFVRDGRLARASG